MTQPSITISGPNNLNGPNKTFDNAALETLTWRLDDLLQGLNSVSQQEKTVQDLRESLEAAERRLADSRQGVVEIREALDQLRGTATAV